MPNYAFVHIIILELNQSTFCLHFLFDNTGTQCLYPPQPPKESNLELASRHDDGDTMGQSGSTNAAERSSFLSNYTNTFNVNATAFYRCQKTMKFSHNYWQKGVEATCLQGNVWKLPVLWGKCVTSKFVRYT